MVQVSEDGIWGQGGRWMTRPYTTWSSFNVAVINVGTGRGYRRAWGGECALQGIGEEPEVCSSVSVGRRRVS